MIRYLILPGSLALCLAACSASPDGVRFVPTSTVYRAEPQPLTTGEFHDAEQQGYLIAATGVGPAYGVDDLPVRMQHGERLHVIRVVPETGEILVKRMDDHSQARLSAEGVEVRGTTYRDRS